MGGKRGYKKGKKGAPEVLASQQLECRDSLGRVVQQVQCQGRGKCDEKARGESGQEKLGRVLSRERRRRRGRKVLFSCVTFCASEIMGDHCPIRQSRGPKGTPARPGSSSSSLLHSLFPPSLLPPRPHPVNPLRHLVVHSAPFPLLPLHTHTCPFVRSVPLTVVHLPPQTSSLSSPQPFLLRPIIVCRQAPHNRTLSSLLAITGHRHLLRVPFVGRAAARFPFPLCTLTSSQPLSVRHTRSLTPEKQGKKKALKYYYCTNKGETKRGVFARAPVRLLCTHARRRLHPHTVQVANDAGLAVSTSRLVLRGPKS